LIVVFDIFAAPMKQAFTFLFILSIVFVSCNSERKENENTKTISVDSTAEETLPLPVRESGFELSAEENYFNDQLRFIAGMIPFNKDTVFSTLMDSSWNDYSKRFNQRWKKLEEGKFASMKEFRAKEIEPLSQNKTLLYPFSGPDFLNAFLFFPNQERYILMALEPAGSIPDFKKFPNDSLKGYLNNIEKSLHAILNFSFFRTISMAEDFNKQEELNGAVHLISIFMQRTGNTLLGLEKVRADSSGKITNKIDGASCGNLGIRIFFKNKASDSKREVIYFSCDLSDNGLARNKCFASFLKNIGPVNTYLKSASYLLHNTYFSKARTAILQNSDLVLQDDSGIPIRYFTTENWNRQLFGTYDKPINLFKTRFQQDLKTLYDSTDKATVKPLLFGIGYDYKPNESNLMLFTKLKR
jgi:hypothetical protein